jgi:hypothetical protein
MAKKLSTTTSVKPVLADELRALDRKDRKFRQAMEPEMQKKFSTYLMLRYAASVEGNADMAAYYLMAANERVNKNFFDLSKHPELQWLSCTTVSPGMGSQRHYWIGAAKKSDVEKNQSALRKQVQDLCPTWKSDEIDLWMTVNSVEAVSEWIQQHGIEVKSKK